MKLSDLFKFQNTTKKYKDSRIYEDINYKQFNKILKENTTVIIDVRSKQEYKESHLDGAINMPLDDIENKIENVVTDKNNIILLYCQYGSRSKKAQNILKKLNYKNVYNLKNGLDGM